MAPHKFGLVPFSGFKDKVFESVDITYSRFMTIFSFDFYKQLRASFWQLWCKDKSFSQTKGTGELKLFESGDLACFRLSVSIGC